MSSFESACDHSALRPDGIWFWLADRSGRPGQGLPALFIDRDGVVVAETHYLHRVEDVQLFDGAAATLALANQLGLPVIMVTNQAGIGRGYYDWQAFSQVSDVILERLAAAGARVDAVVACPFHEDGKGRWRHPAHPMRKPRPGMLLLGGQALGVNFGASVIIGDQLSDLQAGRAAGLRRGIHVLTGHGARDRLAASRHSDAGFRLELAQDIGDPVVLRALRQLRQAA